MEEYHSDLQMQAANSYRTSKCQNEKISTLLRKQNITLTICGVCFNFLLLKFPSPPAAISDTGWISGRRAGRKILFMFWFSFHLLLKFLVYSKAERRNQGITLCHSSYIQLRDHDSLSLWGCLWKGGHITSLLGPGVFRDTYTSRDFIENTVSHIGFISGIIFLSGYGHFQDWRALVELKDYREVKQRHVHLGFHHEVNQWSFLAGYIRALMTFSYYGGITLGWFPCAFSDFTNACLQFSN